MILCVGSRAVKVADLPMCGALPVFARANGIAFFATAVELPHAHFLSCVAPKNILARLAAIDPATLPDYSGLNE
jgi:hypothetical protein